MDYPQEKVMPYGPDGRKAEQVERMFDHIAPAYDRLNHLMSLGIDRSWRRRAIRWLQPFAPQDVLDVATGTGDFALLACRLLKPRSLTGIDISEGMMQVGRQKASEAGLADRIRFRREDCEALSFPDASFDAVTVAFGIRNFEHLDRGLQEMCRVLRPGGHLGGDACHRAQHLARQQRLHLPAPKHTGFPARRGHARRHPPCRLPGSTLPAADVRRVHTLHGNEITHT